MRGRNVLSTSLLPMIAACAGAPMPDIAGRGLIAFDPEPPAGAETWDRPTFRVGDRYALLRGGQVRQDFVIVHAGGDGGDSGVVVQDAAGHQLRRTADLGYLGQWDDSGDPVHLFAPEDTRFHWPLWVGKSWRCEYVDLQPDQPVRTVLVRYTVEDRDRVIVPAGTFETLRIARVETLKVDGETYLDRTSVNWYAPAVGLEVRQLIGGTAFELVEWTRAP